MSSVIYDRILGTVKIILKSLCGFFDSISLNNLEIFIIVLNLSDLKSSTRGDFKLIFLLLSAYYPTIYNPNNVLRGKALCSLDQKVTHCCAKFGP